MSMIRSRWAAVGAAAAVSLGAGGIGLVSATTSSGERAVLTTLDEPCRIASLRPAPFTVGPRSAALAAGDTYSISARGAAGDCNLPADAVALSTNVTALNATQDTNLRFWATGAERPTTANLNPSAGAPPISNAVTTGLSSDGRFDVYNFQGDVQIVIDVLGYYTDHNHDDRYYTKSQTDSMGAGDVIALGFVNAAVPEIQQARTARGISLSVTNPAVGRIDLRVVGADTAEIPIVLMTPHNGGSTARTCNSRTLSVAGTTDYMVRFECFDAAGVSVTTSFQFTIID